MSTTNWADIVKLAGESASGNYEPLPDGDYDLKVVEATATTASTGRKMFKIKAEVQNGAYAKRLVWDNLVVVLDNPKALGAFFSKMAALGLPQTYFTPDRTDAQIEDALRGAHFRVTLGRKTYNGNVSNEIKKYHRIATANVDTVSTTAHRHQSRQIIDLLHLLEFLIKF